MRHRIRNRKLGRTSSHRSALFRNQLASLLEKERIVTTLAKAKELRPVVEKMVTLGREDTVHRRRQAARSIADKGLLRKLFEEISPKFANTPGGYTRIIKLGPRKGDGAEMAILEFTTFVFGEGESEAPVETKAKKKGDETEDEAEDSESNDTETKPAPKKKSASKKKPAAKKKAAKKKSDAKPATKKAAAKKKPAAKKAPSKKKTTRKSDKG